MRPIPDASIGDPDLRAWRDILDRLRASRPPLAAVLEHASPIACSVEKLVLGYEPGSFLATQAMDASAVEALTQTARAFFGSETEVTFDLGAAAKARPSVAAIDQELHRVRLESAKRTVAEHSLVRAAADILQAELREIRLPE
jgi:DNA polymerase III subunit gamma/tau